MYSSSRCLGKLVLDSLELDKFFAVDNRTGPPAAPPPLDRDTPAEGAYAAVMLSNQVFASGLEPKCFGGPVVRANVDLPP
jgi:hypothetical protein